MQISATSAINSSSRALIAERAVERGGHHNGKQVVVRVRPSPLVHARDSGHGPRGRGKRLREPIQKLLPLIERL